MKLRVGALEWKVKRGPLLDDLGRCETERLTITIIPDLPDSLYRDTLRHELLHAVLFTYGCKLDADVEESLVAVLSTVLPGLIADYPDLWT